MKHYIQHVWSYIFRGLLAIIPISLSFLAIRLLYVLIDRRVMVFLDQYFEVRQIPGLGILLVLVCLYLIGVIVSTVIGRQILHLIDRITQKIPVVKAVYSVGKQLSESLSGGEEKQGFKKTILVDCNNNGLWAVAFISGQIFDQNSGETLWRVFVPTVPNPTTGFIFVVKSTQIIDPGWSVEEGIKMLVSGAIISPKEIKKAV